MNYGVLTKITDDRFNGYHPNEIYEGYTRDGVYAKEPTVGESFYIANPDRYLRTSPVTEIVSIIGILTVFKTENSTYRLIADNI